MAKMAKLNFAEDETQLLIDLYRTNESLYDKDHYEYSSRLARKAIIADIAQKLQRTPHEIMAKIEVLRTQFALSLRKRDKALREDGMPQPKEWRFFRALMFLEPHMTKQSQGNNQSHNYRRQDDYLESGGEQDVYNDQDYEPEIRYEVHQISSEAETQDATIDEIEIKEEPVEVRMPKRRANKRRKEPETSDDDQFIWTNPPNQPMMNPPSNSSMSPALNHSLNPPHSTLTSTPMSEDDCDAFGRLVAAELRAMGPSQKLMTKRQIMSIVYGYTLGDVLN